MTDSSSGVDEPTEDEKGGGSGEPELRGRYVEGDYGKTGTQPGRHSEDEEGQYSEGDYGTAGTEGGLPEPLGSKAQESGRYARADLGDAGTVPGRTAESEIGQYAEGDYGADGSVGPLRKSAGTPATPDEPAPLDEEGGT
ncbi:hypothetical protein [Arthrobacter sp. MA-N2]|uniref:hypothetical protein n=1 Tax=Arthrobacter sp. MA-N2 TaxID=1101188 RepID=UPI0004B21138|nr:hypothetical protein [Arthrobacter sp. MA-N2]